MQDTKEHDADAVQADKALQHHIQEAETLTNELKRLLVQHEKVLGEEGIRHHVEVLERWMESYRRGLSAAGKLSDTGTAWLVDLRNRLKLAADERLRLESEGGMPSDNSQLDKTEELLKAVRRIDDAMADIDQLLHHPHPTDTHV